jgi:hypothetical protein
VTKQDIDGQPLRRLAYTGRRTKRVDNAFLLPYKTLYATNPLATVTKGTDALNVVRALEGGDEKVPCC